MCTYKKENKKKKISNIAQFLIRMNGVKVVWEGFVANAIIKGREKKVIYFLRPFLFFCIILVSIIIKKKRVNI